MSVTDEKDKRSYTLSGNAAGVKAGYRMTLQGKRKHTGQTLVFEAHKEGGQFCPQPAFSRLWPPERRLRPRLAALQNQIYPLPKIGGRIRHCVHF